MKWEKIGLVDALGKWVYSDEFGLCRFKIKYISIFVEKAINGIKEIPLRKLYIKDRNGDYKSQNSFEKTFDYIFNVEYGIPIDCYGRSSCLSEVEMHKIEPQKYNITFEVEGLRDVKDDINIKTFNKEHSINVRNQNELNDILLYYNPKYEDKLVTTSLHTILYNELKEGKKLYLCGIGTVEVTKVFEYPDKSDRICLIKDMQSKTREVFSNGQTNDELLIFDLPMNERKKETDLFNKSLNEISLQPYVIKEQQTYNVYWQGLTDAVQYVVELYKLIDYETKRKLYHLTDFYTDRTTTFLSINNLVGGSFIFVVKAEDRSGNIIASSRGLSNGEPKFW